MSLQTVYFNNPSDIVNLQNQTTVQSTQITSMSGSLNTLDFNVSPVQFQDNLNQYVPILKVDNANYDYFVIMRHGPRKIASTSGSRPYTSETSTGTLTAFGQLLKPEYRPVSGDKVYNPISGYNMLSTPLSSTGVSSGLPNLPFTYIGYNDTAPLIQESVPFLSSFLTTMMTGGVFPKTFDYISANNMVRTIQTAQIVINTQKQFDNTGTYNPTITLKFQTSTGSIITNTVGGDFSTGTWIGLPNGLVGLDNNDPWTMGGMFTGSAAMPGTSTAAGATLWYLPNGNLSSGVVTTSNNVAAAGAPTILPRYDTLQGTYKIFRKYYQNFTPQDMFGFTSRTAAGNYLADVRPGNPDNYSSAVWASLTGSFGGSYAFLDYLMQQYYTTGSAINKTMTPQEVTTLMNYNATFLNPAADEQVGTVAGAGIIKAIYDWANNTGTNFPGWTGSGSPSKVFYACNEQCIQSVVTGLGCTFKFSNYGYCFPQGTALILIKLKNRSFQQYGARNFAISSPIVGFMATPGLTNPNFYDTSSLVTRGAYVMLQNCGANKGLITEFYNRVQPYPGNPNTYAGFPYYGWSPYDWAEVTGLY
jgi:hypothetical protein